MEVAGKHAERDLLANLQADVLLATEQAGGTTEPAAQVAGPDSGAATYPILTPEEEHLAAVEGEIGRITSAVQQAPSTSHKARAILQMQKTIEQAKSKYPWAADRLDRAGARYMNTSYRLATLGFAESVNQAKQASAQAELEQLRENAEKLGIDTIRYPVGTAEFNVRYANESYDAEQWKAFEREEKRLASRNTFAGREALAHLNKARVGEHGYMAGLEKSLGIMIEKSIDEGILPLLALGDDELSQKDTARVEAEMAKLNAILTQHYLPQITMSENRLRRFRDDAFNATGPNGGLTNGEEWQQSQVLLDEFTAEANALRTLVESSSTDIPALRKIIATTRARTNLNPGWAKAVEILSMPGMTNALSAVDNAADNSGYRALQGMFPKGDDGLILPAMGTERAAQTLHNVQEGTMPPDATAAEIRGTYWDTPPDTAGGQLVQAGSKYLTHDKAQAHGTHVNMSAGVLQSVANNPGAYNGPSPNVEGALWAFFREWEHNYVQTSGDMGPDDYDTMFFQFGSPDLFTLLGHSRKSETKKAAADLLTDWYKGPQARGTGDTFERVGKKVEALNTRAKPFIQEHMWDDFLETGRVEVVINSAAVNAYVEEQLDMLSGTAQEGQRQATEIAAYERIQPWLDEYERYVNNYMSLLTNMAMAKEQAIDLVGIAKQVGLVVPPHILERR
jgi:hypothetical protein